MKKRNLFKALSLILVIAAVVSIAALPASAKAYMNYKDIMESFSRIIVAMVDIDKTEKDSYVPYTLDDFKNYFGIDAIELEKFEFWDWIDTDKCRPVYYLYLNNSGKTYNDFLHMDEQAKKLEEFDEVGYVTTDSLEFDFAYPDDCRWCGRCAPFLAVNGIISSYTGVINTATADEYVSAYRPYDYLTRAMLVKVLYNLDGRPEVTPKMKYDIRFIDVDKDEWYADAVAWAQYNKIAEGITFTEFAPDKLVTREQFVSFLYRFEHYRGYDMYTTNPWWRKFAYIDFSDVSAYALPAMTWAYSKGYIQGMGGSGGLAPKATITRAQMMTIITRYLRGAWEYETFNKVRDFDLYADYSQNENMD